jgi:hypothetical protein
MIKVSAGSRWGRHVVEDKVEDFVNNGPAKRPTTKLRTFVISAKIHAENTVWQLSLNFWDLKSWLQPEGPQFSPQILWILLYNTEPGGWPIFDPPPANNSLSDVGRKTGAIVAEPSKSPNFSNNFQPITGSQNVWG